jgi:hypothetical protein
MTTAAQTDGLHGKYIIHKADGQPVEYPCFVLRIDNTDPAAIAAIIAYAMATDNSELRMALLYHADSFNMPTSDVEIK